MRPSGTVGGNASNSLGSSESIFSVMIVLAETQPSMPLHEVYTGIAFRHKILDAIKRNQPFIEANRPQYG